MPTARMAVERDRDGLAEDVRPEAVVVLRVAVGQTADAPVVLAPFRAARTAAVACAPAAMAAGAGHPAFPAWSAAVARTFPAPAVLYRCLAATESASVLLPASRLFPFRSPAAWPAAARYAAVSRVAASQARAAAPVVVSCPVPRSAGESSAERIVRPAMAEQRAEVLPRQALAPLRLSLRRRQVVLRLEELRARLRPGGLLRFRQEVVVRPRQQVAA